MVRNTKLQNRLEEDGNNNEIMSQRIYTTTCKTFDLPPAAMEVSRCHSFEFTCMITTLVKQNATIYINLIIVANTTSLPDLLHATHLSLHHKIQFAQLVFIETLVKRGCEYYKQNGT